MYYPLLRARQFELIALRELVNEGLTQGFLVPIIEPVKESLNNLNLVYNVFQEKEQVAYLIVNPLVGDSKGDNQKYLDYLSGLSVGFFKPAFYYRNNASFISDCLRDYELNDCMLICQNDLSIDDVDFCELVQRGEITSINIEDPGKNRSLDRFVKSLNKICIRLDDLFEKRTRNSDFLEIEEHMFSEEHLYFKDERFSGFSDYTVLPSEYVDGGSTPLAVVIHLSFLNAHNQIWIRHFTSVSNDSIANVQGKFAEAAFKAVNFCRSKDLKNSAIAELETYFDEHHYPGLGIVKKIAIKNHLLVVLKYLKSI